MLPFGPTGSSRLGGRAGPLTRTDGADPRSKGVALLTKRGFDAVLMTLLAFHLAAGLPRIWARKAVTNDTGWRRLVGSATLQATS